MNSGLTSGFYNMIYDDWEQADTHSCLLFFWRWYQSLRLSWLCKRSRYLHSSNSRPSPNSVNSISVGGSKRQTGQPWLAQCVLEQSSFAGSNCSTTACPLSLKCFIVLILLFPVIHFAHCSEYPFSYCVLLYILLFHKLASVFSSKQQLMCLRLSSSAMAPTQPSLRSEVFKPCVEDKDLAFCLNEGECSIIETVAGVHRHCR